MRHQTGQHCRRRKLERLTSEGVKALPKQQRELENSPKSSGPKLEKFIERRLEHFNEIQEFFKEEKVRRQV